MLQKVKGLVPDTAARSVFWEQLARSLMLDFVPAYRPNKADGQRLIDWMTAGGTALNFFADLPRRQHFYQAQLVELIEEQARRKDRSRAWVFRWFANEVEPQGPKEEARRISLLPWPYRKRLTEKSLKEAFSKIPSFVRKRPHEYLPPKDSAPRRRGLPNH